METLCHLFQLAIGEDYTQKIPRLFCNMKWQVEGKASIMYDVLI